MKKGQILTGIVERVDFPNKGIVITEEGSCIVKNVLPGQKISFMVQKNRHGRAEGRLLSVEEGSPAEMKSPCPHFGECGGCSYLSLPYEEQLKIKEEQVKKLLAVPLAAQETEWVFEGIKGSPRQQEYRNKMEFSFGDAYKDGPLALGMHKRGSFYDIVTVDGCRIVDEDYRKILAFTREYFDGIPFYHRLRHEGYLRHLLVRKAVKTGEILIALVTTSQWQEKAVCERRIEECAEVIKQAGAEKNAQEKTPDGQSSIEPVSITETAKKQARTGDADAGKWGSEAEKTAKKQTDSECRMLDAWKDGILNLDLMGKITGVLHIVNDSVADVVQSDRTDILYGQDYFYEELLGLKFKISTFSFFQTNSLGAEVLYETAREYIGDLGTRKKKNGAEAENGEPDKVVFDLYSGTGTIAQLMAPVAKKVIGVEIVEEAVEAAKKNAELNGLHNCEFIAGDVLKVLDDITEKPDMIILDPPRDGIHPKALKKLSATIRASRMLYISCKPTSLVRDLEKLQEHGYVVERACCVDMFPHTANVETICLLKLVE